MNRFTIEIMPYKRYIGKKKKRELREVSTGRDVDVCHVYTRHVMSTYHNRQSRPFTVSYWDLGMVGSLIYVSSGRAWA
jgi:hypothetical protein